MHSRKKRDKDHARPLLVSLPEQAIDLRHAAHSKVLQGAPVGAAIRGEVQMQTGRSFVR
jgi:hypothetical protein